MTYEMMVGLFIKDDATYSEYRKAMMPLLTQHGGGFRYDFRVSEVLKNEEGRPINRLFAIYFANEAAMKTFFSDPGYLEIKKKYFEASVEATTILSQYQRP